MITKLFQNIITNQDTRQSLSKLRQEIKDPEKREELQQLISLGKYIEELIALLESEDAKTRKNAALLIGDLELDSCLEAIFQGYLKEEQLFVRSAYLTALATLNYAVLLPKLKEQLLLVNGMELTVDNKKHLESESRALSKLIVAEEGIQAHTFIEGQGTYNCILLTNRLHSKITEEEIPNGDIQVFQAGLKIETKSIEELLAIRTYSELLFVVKGRDICSNDPIEAAREVANSDLLAFLTRNHKEAAPFYFRINLKSKMPLDKKSIFAKRMASELESATNHQLLNSTSNYEIELRLIENKFTTFNLLLKLNTISDKRFTYRQEFMASSIKPVNAALLVRIAKGYMKADAQVLDPFCGVATMLIERQKAVKGNTSYGIDIHEEAIRKAKLNTEHAGQIIHFVNKDFFNFTHEYLFDEIFTNMPFSMGESRQEEIYELYRKFFVKAKELLKRDGTIIMYSHNLEFVEMLSKKNGYKVIKKVEVLEKEGTYLIVLRLESHAALSYT